MVSFRKLFLVLAVVGLIAGTASAQVTSCTATATNVPLVRLEGLTELVGNVTISCSNGTGTSGAPSASFVLHSGTATFTNSLTSTATQPSTTASAATTATGGPVAGVLVSPNELDFSDVPLAASGTTTITISNIRVNANAVGAANTQISMTVTGTAVSPGPPSQSLAVLPSTNLNVALVQSGLTFSVTGAANLAQCSGSTASATLNFAPGFAYAFRAAGTTSAISNEPVDPGSTAKGVQLVAIFSNIGANTKITVPNALTAGTTSRNAATLITPTPSSSDPTGVTSITPSGTTTTVIWQVTTIDSTSNATAKAPLTGSVQISQNGTGTTSAIGLGALAVRGNLGPISTATAALPAADTGNFVPRFIDQGGTTSTVVTVVPCATTLLFPYVVSQAPWETGIAISNTSKDPSTGTGTFLFGGSKDSTGQAGTCTLYYFSGAAGASNPSAQTTASIAPGNESVFLLGSGSATDAGITAVPEFAGYVIAQCKFLGAHGFAFGTSGTANLGAFGYNALVLDRGTSGPANPEKLSQ